MGNCCDSNDIDDTAGRTGVPNEDVYVDAPFGGGGGTLSADVDPVVDKDPVGYMSGDYLSAVASIGKGAYLLYDTLQAGKFEIHYRNSPPPQTAIEQKIVAFGEFIEGETNIADRRFRRNESEVTKTQVTQNSQYVYLAIAEFVLLCFRKKMRLKLVMDGEGL
ncbi:MAG: hypothetical protein KVP17_003282, partial [Porospora cf. gigantea B]|uniref:uncharacterized protein n=1 Tax=Porospora cf. gigantea B TaxID=2853592 RepID=UPI003571B497